VSPKGNVIVDRNIEGAAIQVLLIRLESEKRYKTKVKEWLSLLLEGDCEEIEDIETILEIRSMELPELDELIKCLKKNRISDLYLDSKAENILKANGWLVLTDNSSYNLKTLDRRVHGIVPEHITAEQISAVKKLTAECLLDYNLLVCKRKNGTYGVFKESQ
jgi:enoyl-[acyl-carrier-protein] reductase (NADH)